MSQATSCVSPGVRGDIRALDSRVYSPTKISQTVKTLALQLNRIDRTKYNKISLITSMSPAFTDFFFGVFLTVDS